MLDQRKGDYIPPLLHAGTVDKDQAPKLCLLVFWNSTHHPLLTGLKASARDLTAMVKKKHWSRLCVTEIISGYRPVFLIGSSHEIPIWDLERGFSKAWSLRYFDDVEVSLFKRCGAFCKNMQSPYRLLYRIHYHFLSLDHFPGTLIRAWEV